MAVSNLSHFQSLSDPLPVDADNSTLLRLVDAIGFRYYWATEGLRPQDEEFKPAVECMTLRALMEHVRSLLQVTSQAFGVPQVSKRDEKAMPLQDLRAQTLTQLYELHVRISAMTEADIISRTIKGSNILNSVSGPLADMLTDIGQINSWRGMNGNPSKPVDYLKGQLLNPGPTKA